MSYHPNKNPAIINRLRQILKNYFFEKSRDRTLMLMKKGKLCSKYLFRAELEKKARVFKKKFLTDKNKVDVCIAIDFSGSMGGGHKWETAIDLGFQLYHALKDIEDINFMMFGFTAWKKNIIHYMLKDFGEKLCADYGKTCRLLENNDYESLRWAWKKLKEQPNKKKILFTISDGTPVHPPNGSVALFEETQKIIKAIKNSGVKVISFFIGKDSSCHEKLYEETSIPVTTGNLEISFISEMIKVLKSK